MLLARTDTEQKHPAERRPGVVAVPRFLTFGSRSATRAAIACASSTAKRVAVDVPAGVRLDRVLQK
jgi:hypothetical protein